MALIDSLPDGALERMWREHAGALVRLATVLVGPSEANDIATEAFLRAAVAAQHPDVERPRALLLRAVVNRAHDLRRSNERRWRRDLAAVGPAATSSPDSHVDVRRAVSNLSLQQRSVLYFVYWEDLTEAQTAELLGLSPGTVRRHLVRARDHLRKALS